MVCNSGIFVTPLSRFKIPAFAGMTGRSYAITSSIWVEIQQYLGGNSFIHGQ